MGGVHTEVEHEQVQRSQVFQSRHRPFVQTGAPDAASAPCAPSAGDRAKAGTHPREGHFAVVVARRDLTGRPPICAAILAAVLSIAGAWSFAAPAAGSTAKAARSAVNSADRLIIWTGCRDFVELTDAELGMWKSRGVDGFACVVGHLKGMGGTQNFTSNRRAALRA